MPAKLPLITLSLLFCLGLSAQDDHRTFGRFNYIGTVPVSPEFTVHPSQLTKDGESLIAPLLTDNEDTTYTMLYLVDPESGRENLLPVSLPDSGYSELLTASLSADASVLVCTVNSYGGWIRNDLAMAFRGSDGIYGQVMVLNDLNDPAASDAYPWVSHDGNRLYYLHEQTIMLSERSGDRSLFSEAAPLVFEGKVSLPVLGFWLDKREKRLWILAQDGKMYTSKRRSISSAFPLPELFTAEFEPFYFVSGISFSPDRKEMYLFHSDEAQSMVHYSLKN